MAEYHGNDPASRAVKSIALLRLGRLRPSRAGNLENAPTRDRAFYRYFTLTHLYNAGFDDDQLESHRQGLSKLVNSLSWGRQIKRSVPIDKDKTVLRIDLRW